MTTNKRLDAIKQRLDTPYFVGKDHQMKQDIQYLLSLVEKYEKALIRIEAMSIEETLSEAAQQALKCDEGGEVGK